MDFEQNGHPDESKMYPAERHRLSRRHACLLIVLAKEANIFSSCPFELQELLYIFEILESHAYAHICHVSCHNAFMGCINICSVETGKNAMATSGFCYIFSHVGSS